MSPTYQKLLCRNELMAFQSIDMRNIASKYERFDIRSINDCINIKVVISFPEYDE